MRNPTCRKRNDRLVIRCRSRYQNREISRIRPSDTFSANTIRVRPTQVVGVMQLVTFDVVELRRGLQTACAELRAGLGGSDGFGGGGADGHRGADARVGDFFKVEAEVEASGDCNGDAIAFGVADGTLDRVC